MLHLLNIDNIHFEHMVHRIYPAELQLNKPNASDTEAAILDLNLSIHNGIVSTCLVVNPIMFRNVVSIFNCMSATGKAFRFSLLKPGLFRLLHDILLLFFEDPPVLQISSVAV